MPYPAYTEYKDSGVSWLGEVPKHWEFKRAKFIVSYIGSGKTPKGGAEVYVNDGIMLLRSQNIYDDGLRLHDVVFITDEADENQSGSRVKSNDVLLNITGASIGRASIVPNNFPIANVNQHVCILRPNINSVTPKYLHLLLCSKPSKDQIVAGENGTSREGLNFQQVASLIFAIPTIEEQQTIANFLDHKTGQIDALIAKKEALLEKLAEKRSALISHAVTKGLNPQARMKDSGVEWLGEVPEHWQVKRLRFCVNMNPSKNEIKLPADALVSFIPMDAVGEHGGLRLDDDKELSDIGSGYTYFANNDVVVAKITPCFENGKGAIAKELTNGIAFGTTELHVIRADNDLLPEYLFQLTQSHPFMMIGESEMYGAGGQKRIPEAFIKDFKIGLPPLPEQKKIIEYIKQHNGLSQQQFNKASEAINKLKEYRSALITNAVTGKIDVRNYAAHPAGSTGKPSLSKSVPTS